MHDEHPHTWVFWIHAENHVRVHEGFQTIAEMVKLPGRNGDKADVAQLVHVWLSNTANGKWLLILDSADTEDVFFGESEDAGHGHVLADYLPKSSNGTIIITTRNKQVAYRLTEERPIEVGLMTEKEALDLFHKRLSLELWDPKLAPDLVQELEQLPLAISQAAGYINQRTPRGSIEKYLADFRKTSFTISSLLEHDVGDPRRDRSARNSVLTTWQMSFDQIKSERPSAADLLCLMSFFDRQGIPEELLTLSDGVTAQLIAKQWEGIEEYLGFEVHPDNHEKTPLGRLEEDEHELVLTEQDVSHSCSDHPGQACASARESTQSDTGNDNSQFEDDAAMLRSYSLITTNMEGNLFEVHELGWLQKKGEGRKISATMHPTLSCTIPHR